MRDEAPTLTACATAADVAAIARRSSPAAPGMVSSVHVAPPSTVCTTVPRHPLAHATCGDTTLSPRSSAAVGLGCGTHCADAGLASTSDWTTRRNDKVRKQMG